MVAINNAFPIYHNKNFITYAKRTAQKNFQIRYIVFN